MELKKDSKVEQDKNITTRQAGLIVLCVLLALKVVLFPAEIGEIAGGGLWLSYLINGIITLIVLAVTIIIIKKCKGRSFEEVLNSIFGKVITKILLAVLFIFFVSKLLFFNNEVKDFLNDTLYFNLDFNFFVIPILFLIGFLVYKGIRVIGRTAEIFVIFGLIVFFISIIFSFSNIDISNFNTLIDIKAGPIFDGVLMAFSRAGDFLVLLIVMDKVQFKKKEEKNKKFGGVFGYGIIAMILVTFFLIICELVFGLEVINIRDSIIKITNFTGGANSVFKLDGLIALSWLPMIILYAAVNLYGGIWCLKKIFNAESTFWAVAIVIALTYIFNFINMPSSAIVISNQVLAWLTIGIEIFVILLWVLVMVKKEKQYG